MLQVLSMRWSKIPTDNDTSNTLFNENPRVTFTIKAPMYWWIDIDWVKYRFNMPRYDYEFCIDESNRSIDVQRALQELLYLLSCKSDRQVMQLLPLSTIVTAKIELPYQEVITVCENYVAGEYRYTSGFSFPNEREWKDFCETLSDIKGVRDIIKEEC